ncbi:HupU protein [Ramlibacter sp. AN1133]|uniref:NADH-quinone oxidoreductase subunit B family protein n=1 Tax=Ramlibacter sp. AN1133 TaxID=3133429 RepID=UPI0030BFDDE4
MPTMMRVLWLQSGGCGGCSMSMLCADTQDFAGLLHGAGVEVLWHPALSQADGAQVVDLLEAAVAGRERIDALCIEGALLRGPHGSGRFHVLAGTGRPMVHWVRELAAVAQHVLAIGSCAAWGGFTSDPGGATEACGLQYEDDVKGGLLGAGFRSRSGLPVVNVAGCPTHPGWVLETLMGLAAGALTEADLDPLGRPRFYADQLVHQGCSRNEYYEYKASATLPAQQGCLMEHMGCKGTQAHADCNRRLWNGAGSCARGGYPCISCTEPGFQRPGHPFHLTPKVAGIPIGLPTDMPKAWFVALASLSKSATPKRVKVNATSDRVVLPPQPRKTGLR